MKEPHRKGQASHSGPESCDGLRKESGEALTGESAGRAIELRNHESGTPTLLSEAEGYTTGGIRGEPHEGPAQSKTLSMRGHFLHGNRDTPAAPDDGVTAGRSVKAINHKTDAHAAGESHGCIVPEKLPNKGGSETPPEAMEGRHPTKRNAPQTATHGTLSPDCVPSGLGRVRKAASLTFAFTPTTQGKNRMR